MSREPLPPLSVSGHDHAPVARAILAVLPETGVVMVDAGLRIRFMDGEILRDRFPTEALVGRDAAEALPAPVWERVRPHWIAALAGASQTTEWTTIDGGRAYRLHFAPLRDDEGAVAGAMLVAQDISRRAAKRRERERDAGQQAAIIRLWRLLLDDASIGELLQAVAQALIDALGADVSTVVAEDAGGDLVVLASAGEPLPAPKPPSDARPRVLEHVRATGRPLLISDLDEECLLEAPVLAKVGMVSLVAAPVASAAADFGALSAASRSRQAFSERDLGFLEAVGHLVAEAMDRERARDRATRVESRLAAFWALSTDLLSVTSADGRFVEASPSWERVLGWSEAELRDLTLGDLVVRFADDTLEPDHPREAEAAFVALVRGKDGAERWMSFERREGGDGFVYSTGRDVTESLHAAEELRRREQQLNEAQRLAGIGSWEVDLETGHHQLSPNLRAMLQIPADEQVDDDAFLARVHPDDREAVRGAMAEQIAGQRDGPPDFRILLPDGGVRILSSRGEAVWGEGRLPIGLRGTVQDVTERRLAEQRLAQSEERFRQGFDHAPIAMTLVDAQTNRFLRVNDAYCQMVGHTRDELLRVTFRDVLHPDEPGPTDQELQTLDHRGAMVSERRYLRPDGVAIWASVHVSRVSGVDGATDVFFAQSVDVTARHAQEEAMRRQLAEVAWIGEIRAALAEDRFELHGQPIVDLRSGRVTHDELLLRMRDRDGQLVPPVSFLPTAERYGDIRDIDRWVISRGMEIAGSGRSVAINISGTSIGDPCLIGHIDAELERTGADPALLIFEITETALVESAETAGQLARGLRERGCRFALDDFGTGYGGFHYLKTLPIDILKIDREFVRDVMTSESDRHLVWAAVSLAARFGLETIAEGVEDAETLALLTEIGVDFAQGYHLGRPAPLDD